ncbi:MAG: TolC family protein, partial [Longimicrobiales bacterium]|nr:TolC family protein [Longimicrobiales bacterium]
MNRNPLPRTPIEGVAGHLRRTGRARVGLISLTAALAVASGQASAQDATLETLLAVARADNPAIVAAERAAAAAAARVPQAGAPPDPTVGLGFMNVPVSGPGFGKDPMTMTQIQIGSRLPWPGKLSLAEAAARLQAEAARWEAEGVRQDVAARVKTLYFRTYFLDRALEVTER